MFSSKPAHLGLSILILTALFALLALETQGLPTQINSTPGTKGKSPLLLIPRNNSDSNATHAGTDATTPAANPNVEITIHNTLNTNKVLYVYITGLPNNNIDGSQAILKADGSAAAWDVLDAQGSEIPVNITTDVAFRVAAAYNSTTTLTLPSYVAAARLYIVEGAEMPWQMVATNDGATTSIVQPVATTPGTTAYDNRWGFVEFTSTDGEFFVNLSFVDFVSLGLGISVIDDGTRVEYVVPGLSPTLKALEAAEGMAHASSESLSPKYHNGTPIAHITTTTTHLSSSSSSSSRPTLVRRPESAAPALVTNTTTADILEAICASLQAQSQKDGNAWDKLCIYANATTTSPETVLRILSPQDGLQQDIPFASPSYYETYISRVWSHYTNNNTLYIDTQNPDLGTLNSTLVPCTVDPSTQHLLCAGATTPMPRPVTSDIWGCNTGAFAINDTAQDDDVFKAVVPRVCAAFVRSTLLLGGGNVQPGPANSTFYQNEVTNHYARILHEHEGVGGYAFPYDDVGVYGENEEGAIQVASAKRLDIYVG